MAMLLQEADVEENSIEGIAADIHASSTLWDKEVGEEEVDQ